MAPATPPPRDYRLPALAVLTWLQILLSIASPVWGVGLGLFGVLALAAGWSRRGTHRGYRHVAVFWLVSLLGVGATLAHESLRNPSVLTERDGTGGHQLVVENENTLNPGDRFVSVRILQAAGQDTPRVRATLFVEPSTERVPPGALIEVTGSLLSTSAMDATAWRVFASNHTVIQPSSWWQAGADQMRESFLERSLAQGGDGGALLPGLALGDTTGVSESLEADMRTVSLAHLVAVSGANCALVVGIAVALTALLGGGVRTRLVVGVFTLVGFVILVTPEPSVIRAAVMATIALAAIAWGRPSQGMAVLSLTVWVLLLADPWRAVEFAFVLSVAATAGIVLGLRPMAGALTRVMPAWLAWWVALPLVAQLAVQPIIVLLRPTLPLYAIPANVLAAPFVPAVTISGLVGSVSSGAWPWLSWQAAAIGWWPSSAIAAIARSTARAPVAELPWFHGVAGVFAAAALSTVVWWAIWRRRIAVAGLGAMIVIIATVVTSSAPQIVARLARPAQWQIAQCDVGQGDALALRTSRGVLVIDTGDDEHLLRACLAVLGVSKVEWLLLSHFDRDHVGQSAVFHSRADTVLTGSPDNAEDLSRLADLEQSGATIRHLRAGQRVDLGDYTLHVLWPSDQPLAKPGNDSSLVVWLEPHQPEGVSMVALGDLGEKTQSMLRSRLPEDPIDVVKVSHHGSADQSRGLYRDVGAPIALIGVGADNDYGHPASSLTGFLDSLGTHVLRSDQRGTLTLHRGESGVIELWSERGG